MIEAVAADSRSFVWRDAAMERVVQARRADRALGGERCSSPARAAPARRCWRATSTSARPRKDRPFVSVNCAAIPDNLLETELFGHEKGAFTGAVARRIGKFEEANGGTLLLDEISEMDVRLQAKLLRALQERVIDRVGGAQPVTVDIRIIATSNRNLADEVRKGSFREDLFYRLNVVHLRIPPLRERPADVLELAAHFGRKYADLNGVAAAAADGRGEAAHDRAAHGAATCASSRTRCIARCCSPTGPEIDVDAIRTPEGEALGPAASDPATRAARTAEAVTRALVGRTVAQVEQDLILDTLDHCLGNRTHAAKILGISIRTLRNKLGEYTAAGAAVPEPGQARVMGA